MKQILSTILTITALAAGSMGCGAHYNKKSDYPTGTSLSVSAASVDSQDYNCPTGNLYNVTAAPGTTHNDSAFTVCRAKNDATRFMITGYTSSQTLCIYPAERKSGSSTAIVISAKQCHTFGTTGIITQMPAITNYVYIIDADHSNAMDAALSGTGNYPPYTGGSIK